MHRFHGPWVPLSTLLAMAVAASAQEPSLPYRDDPEIVKRLTDLPAGRALLLPAVKHVGPDGKELKGEGRSVRPYSRDYTNRMVYAPERRTALYQGGNHGDGRTNDVWEFHLGSNTWHQLFAPQGGDHARFKLSLMFTPRKFAKDPSYQMDDKEKANWDQAKKWWLDNVVLKDGHLVTQGGAPLLVGHTWDTLVYEPNLRRTIHGTGAHCANDPWLHSRFTGRPLDEVQKQMTRSLDQPGGTRSYRTMWLFDPAEKKWIHYESESPLANLRGMGATMCYIPDWKKTIFYVAAMNVTPHEFTMRTYDAINERWEELRPNGGKSIARLFGDKLCPGSEQQTAYSPRHRKMVAVLGSDTFVYDIARNEWSRSAATHEFIKSSDADTVFAYDSAADLFLLCDPRQGTLGAYSLATDRWEQLEPAGDAIPKPPYCVGKGYYDPAFNVLVIQPAYTNRMWVYRHRRSIAD